MDEVQWIGQCAERLREQWPHAPAVELREAARELHSDPKWAAMQPEVAAVIWLRLGVLAE